MNDKRNVGADLHELTKRYSTSIAPVGRVLIALIVVSGVAGLMSAANISYVDPPVIRAVFAVSALASLGTFAVLGILSGCPTSSVRRAAHGGELRAMSSTFKCVGIGQ